MEQLLSRPAERAVLQARLNGMLEHTAESTVTLRDAAVAASFDVERLSWDGGCNVATGVCLVETETSGGVQEVLGTTVGGERRRCHEAACIP